MSDRRLELTPDIARAIGAHGEETYPHECCGALVGVDGRVTDILPLPNTTEEGPRRRFLVRPADYRAAERRASDSGAELLGFYHSHPDHPARPSQYDLDHAWPTFAYVIVSVKAAEAGLPGRSAGGETGLPGRSAGGETGLPGRSAGGETGLPGRSAGGAKAGDMTVWYLSDDRSSFTQGELHYGENTHPDTASALHR